MSTEPTSKPNPPAWLIALLEHFLSSERQEDVLGDLYELFYRRVATKGERQAKYLFLLDTLLLLVRPNLTRHTSTLSSTSLSTSMLSHYLTMAFRSLCREKAFAFLTILGLATGMAFSLLILLWVQHEWSYDRFHSKADGLYRITAQVSELQTAISPSPMAPTLLGQLPQVENMLRLKPTENLLEVNGEKFEEKGGYYADASFFDLFSFPLLAGHSSTALSRIDGIVLSERLAKKYFGTRQALGKIIHLDNHHSLVVTGVMQVPLNTHLQANYLLPLSFLEKQGHDLHIWGNLEYYSYIRLKENISTREGVTQGITTTMNALFAQNEKQGQAVFGLQSVSDIYLHSDLVGDVPSRGNIAYVRLFSGAALCILIVACINFMNLSTARSAKRAREVGVRKVMGARRSELVGQFLTQSLLVAFLALLLALGMAWILLPFFNTLTDKQLTLRLLEIESLLGLFGIALFTGLLSGSYPALLLSSFQPISVLKGMIQQGRWSLPFRNVLVVAQFTLSIILIVATATVYQQMELLRNKHLGFEKENLVYVPIRGELDKHGEALAAQLASNPLTSQFTFVSELPINSTEGSDAVWEGKSIDEQVIFYSMQVDAHFPETFRVELLTGRGFSAEIRQDTANYLVNEAALRMMGMDAKQAIGKWFDLQYKGKIIGVVKDFHFRPLHQKVEPLVLEFNNATRGKLVLRVQSQATKATLVALEQIMNKLNPDYPFSYGFVDGEIAKNYSGETRMGQITQTFACLAIFISCLGLYGLSAFTAQRRIKEIGIRKVLGASVSELSFLLSKDVIPLVVLAFLLASPIAWYLLHGWLEGYAYRIEISPWSFALAGLLVLVVALLTVSWQSVKAALVNPTKTLRND
ncbi:ABC transporter permease [Rhodocytophaga aerolata]|uniref:ABC transporter permease n=1 Tax=Rhodocytophaga aerolata TaxID=455078 RepID=A0ABT8RHZ5_9BACT|nr:FtsX-like permease family protein [Rhodocytophaga aerolata]MDO1451726.1 ABC transporter permease [Rhodocytophaga aerolata]